MPSERETVDALTRVLVRACRALAIAGRPREAGRLAGDAWVVLRRGHPRQAQHVDGAMHHIARLEQQMEQAGAARPAVAQSTTAVADPITPIREVAEVTTDERVLDVRSEIPRRRHELIFETFTALPPGDAYVLVNDHDPKPLRYQFEAENAGEFSWEYLEEGPEVWRVRIGRTAAAGATGA